MRRLTFATALLSSALLATACSSSAVEATPENIASFCAGYEEYLYSPDADRAEQMRSGLLDSAPEGVHEHLETYFDAVEDADEQAQSEAFDKVGTWIDNNCEGSGSTPAPEPSGPADAATAAWCNTWAEYYYKKDTPEAETLIGPAIDTAPAEIKPFAEDYRDAVESGEGVQAAADVVIIYWHKACPNGDNYVG